MDGEVGFKVVHCETDDSFGTLYRDEVIALVKFANGPMVAAVHEVFRRDIEFNQ